MSSNTDQTSDDNVEFIILPEEIPVFKRCFVNSEEFISQYRRYGPANPQVNEGREDDDYKYCQFSNDGVCYMLTCNCVQDDPDVPNFNWYNGKCNYVDPDGVECRVTFNSKSEAWRTPLDTGGFNGCFCRDHFRRCIPRPEDPEEFSLFHTLCDIMIIVREKYPVIMIPDHDDLYDDPNVTFEVNYDI